MADAQQISVVITATAAQLRRALTDAKGDVSTLGAAIKAVPDQINVDVAAQTQVAMARLSELRASVGAVPRALEIRADADIAPAMAKLAALRREVALSQAKVSVGAEAGLTPSLLAQAAAARGPAAGAQTGATVIYGVRGPGQPGSITNPLTTVAEDPKFTTIGSRGVPVGSSAKPAPVIPVAPAGGGGGGGGGGLAALLGGAAGGGGGGGGPSILSRLGLGTGIAGAAGFGSALSFAGLDFTHLVTTILGILGSAAGGAAGGGLLAAGAGGTLAVGGGSDLAVMKSTIADTKTLSTALSAVQTAVATYGANSTQAATATQALNVQMAALGNTAGVQAELGLAKATQALNQFWDKATSGARVQAVNVLMQGVQAGFTFVPLVADAAQRNLSIINDSLKPLFAWLRGPDGIGIFHNLEQEFAARLPTAMDAFKQGIELILRVVNIASTYTGGFTRHLDDLLTRLNNLDNAQLGAVVARYVADFRLWETFVKLLVIDIYDLFHQDVGTGNAIISTLNGMLEKLHAYETSARGSAQIQSIFMIHKTEILALLHILGSLIATFVSVYLAVAPALVAAMNNVVLPVLKAVADVIAAIARTSPFAATAIGLGLIAAKAGGILATATAVKSLVMWLTGLGVAQKALAGGAVAGAAGGGAAAAAGGVARGLPGLVEGGALWVGGALEAAGAGGAGLAVVGAGGAIAAALPIVLPALLTVGVIGLIADKLGLFSSGRPDFTARPGGSTDVSTTAPHQVVPFTPATSRFGLAPGRQVQPTFSAGDTLDIKRVGDFSNYSAVQLKALIAEMKIAGTIKVNGITETKNQVIALAQAALKVKDDWNRAFNSAWSEVQRFFLNTSRSLPALVDDFNTGMRKIASTMGTNSATGRQLVAAEVGKMVAAVTAGMLSGKVSVTQGMAAINAALKQGMSTGAINWTDEWHAMFQTVTQLYEHHKISTAAYMADLRQIMGQGYAHIHSDTQTSEHAMFEYLKGQEAQGNITHGEFLAKWHKAQTAANATETTDMTLFAGQIVAAMEASGTATGAGMDAVVKQLNQALGALGAAKVSLPQVQATGAVAAASKIAGQALGAFKFAPGGYVGSPGQAGPDAIPIVVGAGEAILNRHQQGPVETALQATYGMGLGELFQNVTRPHYMASGGFAGNVPAMIAEANKVTAHHYPYVWGGGHGSFAGPYDCSGAVSDVLHAGGVLNAPRVSGDFMSYGLPGPGQVTLYANPTHVYMSIDGRFFGTSGSNPGGGAGWFAGAPRAGFAVRHVAGGGGSIQAPKVSGSGAQAAIVRGALKKGTGAANTKLAAAMATAFGGTFGGGNANENLANQALGKQMMLAAGFSADQWPALQALWSQESGWDANAVNPSSGAAGIAQSLGHGPVRLGDARSQIAWGLSYIKGRYRNPAGAEAHERAFNWYARGGFAGRRRFGPGGIAAHAAAAPRPPKPRAIAHPKTPKVRVPKTISDALKGLLPTGVVHFDQVAAGYAQHQVDLSTADQQLTYLQGLAPYPAQPLVTLTDADVAALDPSGKLGYETGDQLVNQSGMTVGRFFGTSGIQGGSWVPGISQRQSQISEQLTNLYGQQSSLTGPHSAGAFYDKAWNAGWRGRSQREARRKRVLAFLRKQVIRAKAIQSELKAITTGNLQKNLRTALSRQAISGRLGALRADKQTISQELAAERLSQSQLPTLERDPTHTAALEAQLNQVNQSIGVEQQLQSSGAAKAAVSSAKLAIYKNALTSRLAAYASVDKNLGGSAYDVGTGGILGQLQQQIDAIDTQRASDSTSKSALAPALLTINNAIASYLTEQAGLPGTSAIQVRTPGAGTGPDQSALNALLTQQLATTRQDLATSQAQFGVLQGFAPLLQGRLVGSFQSGIDFVPATGLAMVHKGETILPDQGGPQGNRAAATVHTAQGETVIELHFDGDSGSLVKLVDARINQRGLRVVSDHSGQRARLLAGVRRLP